MASNLLAMVSNLKEEEEEYQEDKNIQEGNTVWPKMQAFEEPLFKNTQRGNA